MASHFSLELQQDRAVPVIEAARLGFCNLRWRAEVTICMFSPSALRPGLRNGVYFQHRGESAQFAQTYLADVLVVVPEVLPLLMPVPVRARIVWTGNAFTNGGRRLGCPRAWAMEQGRGAQNARLYSMALLEAYVDRAVARAQWHARYMSETLGISSRGVTVTYLGVALECYRAPAPARHRYRLVYTNQARRGMGPVPLNPLSVVIRPWFVGNPGNGNCQQPGTKNRRGKKTNNATDK